MINIRLDTHAYDYPEIAMPDVWRVRFSPEAPTIGDLASSVRAAIHTLAQDPRIRTGAQVAVGVGSRGIDRLPEVVATVVDALRALRCQPFVVPAMGSHGGATADGQVAILAGYGISYETVGSPIRATMDAPQVASLDDGFPVYFDANALAADAVVVVNRIKHHTDFVGEIESGIAKMCAVGLGKQRGAASIHRFGAGGLRDLMPRVARALVASTNIVGGVALIENAYGRIAEVHAVAAADIANEKERELLARARSLAPRLAFDNVDVLVVDRMGKDISGSGVDSHVVGRLRMPSIAEGSWPGARVRMVTVLDLTERTRGNAAGLGLVDVVTRRLAEKIDFAVTSTNHRTSGEGGAYRSTIPIIAEDARMAVRVAMGMCGRGRISDIRLARIADTENVTLLEVTQPLLAEAHARADLTVVSGPAPLNPSSPLTPT
ncbi:MAG TPA: hypothetical protein VLH79_02285 [Chthonomonadales bacterium]|nr:hypothetical protein [Chthonomonadales bacterium]